MSSSGQGSKAAAGPLRDPVRQKPSAMSPEDRRDELAERIQEAGLRKDATALPDIFKGVWDPDVERHRDLPYDEAVKLGWICCQCETLNCMTWAQYKYDDLHITCTGCGHTHGGKQPGESPGCPSCYPPRESGRKAERELSEIVDWEYEPGETRFKNAWEPPSKSPSPPQPPLRTGTPIKVDDPAHEDTRGVLVQPRRSATDALRGSARVLEAQSRIGKGGGPMTSAHLALASTSRAARHDEAHYSDDDDGGEDEIGGY